MNIEEAIEGRLYRRGRRAGRGQPLIALAARTADEYIVLMDALHAAAGQRAHVAGAGGLRAAEPAEVR
jgi:hypothetical protein